MPTDPSAIVRTDLRTGSGFYAKQDGRESYWLCHESSDADVDHVHCMRIDLALYTELVLFAQRLRRSP